MGKGKIVEGVMSVLKGESRVGKFIGKATKQVKAIRRVRAIKKARKIKELDEAEKLASKTAKRVKGGRLGKLAFTGGTLAAGVSWLSDTVGNLFSGKSKDSDYKTDDQLELERQAAARERDRLREQKVLKQKGLAKAKTERELVEKRLDELRQAKVREENAIQRLNLLVNTSFTDLDKLQIDKSRLEEQNESLKEDMINSNGEDSGSPSRDNSEVVNQLRDNQSETDSLQNRVAELQSELDDRRERLNRIVSEINELEGREADIDSSIDELENESKNDPQKPVIDAVKGYAEQTKSILNKVLTGLLLAPAIIGIVENGFDEVKETVGGWFTKLWDDISDLFEAAFSDNNEDEDLTDEQFAEKLQHEADEQAKNDTIANAVGTGANLVSGAPLLSPVARATMKEENKLLWDWASNGGWKPQWMTSTDAGFNTVKGTGETVKAVKTAEEVALTSKAAIEGERLAADMVKTTEGAKMVATGSKVGEKSLGKTLMKRLPFVGLAIGAGLGAMRASEGDYAGASLETLSGIVQLADFIIPGLGTLASLLIDSYIAMRDHDYDSALQTIAKHEYWKLAHARELEEMTPEQKKAYQDRASRNLENLQGRIQHRTQFGRTMDADATRVANPAREVIEAQAKNQAKAINDKLFKKRTGRDPLYWDTVDPGSEAFDPDAYFNNYFQGDPQYRNAQWNRARQDYDAMVAERRSGKSFDEGGYTGSGDSTEVAGIVHKDEYVIPSNVKNDPAATPIINELEKMRQHDAGGRDIRANRPDDLTAIDAKKNRYLAEVGFLQAFTKIQNTLPDIDSVSTWEFDQAKRVFIGLPFIGLILKRGGLMNNLSHYNWRTAVKEYLNIATMIVNEVEACLGGTITAYYNYLYTGDSAYVDATLANANIILGGYSKRGRARIKKAIQDRLNDTDATLLKQLEDLADSESPEAAPMNDMNQSGGGGMFGFTGLLGSGMPSVQPAGDRVGTIIEGSAPIYSQLNLDIKGAGRKNNNPGNNTGSNPFSITSQGAGGSGNTHHTAYATLEDGYAGNTWTLLNYLSGKSRWMKANPTLRNVVSTWVDGQPATGPQFNDARIAKYEKDSGIKADTPIPLTEDNLLRLVLTIGKHDSSYVNPSQARTAVRRAIQKWKESGNGDVNSIADNTGFSILDRPSDKAQVKAVDNDGSYRFGITTPWASPESTPVTQGTPGGQEVAAVRMSPTNPADPNSQYTKGEYDNRFQILENKVDAVLAMGFDTNVSVKSAPSSQTQIPPTITRPKEVRKGRNYGSNLG